MTPAVERLRAAVVCLLITALVTVQGAGRVVPDTKLSLTQDPVGYLLRAVHLWDPAGGAGQLQNQAYGYLFPEGPLHAVLIGAGMPAWSVQRLWQSVVLVTAFLGARAVAGRLRLGTPGTRLLGALAFALSPRAISQVGAVSGELWPYALIPWVLLPLIDTSRGVRRAAALSGLAVLLAGGINAAATLAVLPLPALWLLTREKGPRRQSLTLWWIAAVIAATAWWLGPLLLLGRFSPPFLDVIESSATTTGPTGLWAVLTGNDLWLQYLGAGLGAVRPAGGLLVEQPALVLGATVVAAVGLFGCLRSGTAHRRFLLAAVLLGVLIVGAGHVGALTGPFAPYERSLLDGPLAAFRNVHKYDGLLRLPLALGLAEAAALRRTGPVGAGRLRELTSRPAALLATLALVGTATPALVVLQPPGSFVEVPAYWTQAAAFLDEHAGSSSGPTGRAMLVPGAPFGEYVWGRPLDEPLVSLLDRGSLVVRDNVPLGGPGVTRALDAVQEVLETGRGSAGLAPFLQRSGVRYVVARNDLDLFRSGAVPPVLVRAALTASPGLSLVASFGPRLPAGLSTLRSGQPATVPAIQVYEVRGAAGPSTVVDVVPRAGTLRLSGGPETLLPLLEQGVVGARTPVRLAGEPPLPAEAAEGRVVTDGYRDREVGFGRGQDYPSGTLGDGTAPRAERPVHDYLPVPARGSVTALVLPGTVRASSSAADAGAVVARGRDHLPAAAFDGDAATAWVTGGLAPVGQWVQARPDLASLGAAGLVSVTVSVPAVDGADLRPVRVQLSGAGARDVTVMLGDGPVTVAWTGSTVRATIEAVRPSGRVGASPLELGLTGADGPLALVASLSTPADAAVATGGRPAAGPTTLAFSAGRRDRPGCLANGSRSACVPGLARGDEDDAAIDRTVVLDRPLMGTATAQARPRPGDSLAALVQQRQPVRVHGSSSAVADLRGSPLAAVDGTSGTTWIADRADPRPELTLTYDTPQRVTRLSVLLRPGELARLPARVTIAGDDGSRQTVVVRDGSARLAEPLLTRRLVLRFPALEDGDQFRRDTPVGLSELVVRGPAGPAPGLDLASDREVVLGCGPTLVVDGAPRLSWSARASVRRLVAGALLDLMPCAESSELSLSAGAHRLRLARTDVLQPVSLTVGPRAPDAPASRSLDVRRWDATDRRLTVGPGPESLVVVREAANPGWAATLGGTTLTPVVLDGWQQGFVLPAGAGGDILLRFGPDRTFRTVLLLGGLLAFTLLILGVLMMRPGRGRLPGHPATSSTHPGPDPAGGSTRAGGVLSLLVVPLIGGVPGLLALVATAGLLTVVGRRSPALPVLPALGAGALVLAGLIVSVAPWPSGTVVAGPVQALCLVALTALGISLARSCRGPSSEA